MMKFLTKMKLNANLQRRLFDNNGKVAGAWTLYRVKMKVTRKGNDILLGFIIVCRLTLLESITLPIIRAYPTDRFDRKWTMSAEKMSIGRKKTEKKKNEKAHIRVCNDYHLNEQCACSLAPRNMPRNRVIWIFRRLSCGRYFT